MSTPICNCYCHPHEESHHPHDPGIRYDRHPLTGCCDCCPMLRLLKSQVVDTRPTTGRGTSYVLHLSKPLLMEGDHLDIDGATYEVTGIERQVFNGYQSVLLKSIPAHPAAYMYPGSDISLDYHEHALVADEDLAKTNAATFKKEIDRAPEILRTNRQKVVQPPSAPPWYRPDVVLAYLNHQPGVTWESLSTPEQAQVMEITHDLGVEAEFSTIQAGLCPIHRVELTEDGRCPAWGDLGEPEQEQGTPTQRQRVAYAIRNAYNARSDSESNDDRPEWWFAAADAVMGIIASDLGAT